MSAASLSMSVTYDEPGDVSTPVARLKLSVRHGKVPRMPHPMTRPCPKCGEQIPFTLVYPLPEVNSHWLCPRDGSRWDLGDDSSKLVPFGSIHREPVGRPE